MTIDRVGQQAKDWMSSAPEPARHEETQTDQKGFDAHNRPNLHSPDQVRAQQRAAKTRNAITG
jgi:hypothetical protein